MRLSYRYRRGCGLTGKNDRQDREPSSGDGASLSLFALCVRFLHHCTIRRATGYLAKCIHSLNVYSASFAGFLLMGHGVSNRYLAAGLLKTLRRLESDLSIDHDDPAFIHLKCSLLERILHVEAAIAESHVAIHPVERRPRIRIIQIIEQKPAEDDKKKKSIA